MCCRRGLLDLVRSDRLAGRGADGSSEGVRERLAFRAIRNRHQLWADARHATKEGGNSVQRYPAPTTLKSRLTKMWCGQLTPMLWTSYSPLLSFTTRSTMPPG